MDLSTRLLILLAGLMGGAGVAAAAAAAHVGGGANLETAAHFLIFHAAALMGLAALIAQVGQGRGVLLAGAGAIGLGALLFSGDLALRALTETKLLGGSAPFGGSLMIAGWLVAGLGGLFARRA